MMVYIVLQSEYVSLALRAPCFQIIPFDSSPIEFACNENKIAIDISRPFNHFIN